MSVRLTLAVVAFAVAVVGAAAFAYWLAPLRNVEPTLARAGVATTVLAFLGSLLRFARLMLVER